jgi:type I restriction enzyme M protein
MLLDEAQLKAIVSLPQGLFVSKGGQGPKTSILLYEKGGKTDWVWFYKVTNDGYTLGTNRKEQKGNQLVECLDLFHKYVKLGQQPPESKHQFCIPAGWIKALDPRIKEKIRTETRADMEARGNSDRIKKTKDLDKKIASGKLTEAEKQMELKLFDQMLENRIQNEIAKRIDKAHNYSFNLSNYRSKLSESQISELKEAFKTIKPNGSTTLDEVYKKISQTNPEASLPFLANLNPISALEADIGREYVSNLDENVLTNHKELSSIREILRSKIRYPIEKLEGKIEPIYVKIKKDDYDGEIDIIEKISFADGKIQLRDENETGMDLYKAEKGDLITSKINIHQGAIALADRKLVCSTHYQVYEIDTTQILPEYLVIALRSKQFQDRIKEVKNNGIKNEQGADFLKSQEIPLPSPEEQAEIVRQIEKQKEIIEGINKLSEHWDFSFEIDESTNQLKNYKSIGDVCTFEYGVPLKESERMDGKYPVVGAGNIIGFHNKYLLKGPVIVTGRRGATSGSIQWIDSDCFVIDTAFYISVINENEIDKRFLYYILKNLNLQKLQNGGAMPGINRNDVYKEKFYLPDIETQRQIATKLDMQMEVLNSLQKMKEQAEQRIKKIQKDMWGMEIS